MNQTQTERRISYAATVKLQSVTGLRDQAMTSLSLCRASSAEK